MGPPLVLEPPPLPISRWHTPYVPPVGSPPPLPDPCGLLIKHSEICCTVSRRSSACCTTDRQQSGLLYNIFDKICPTDGVCWTVFQICWTVFSHLLDSCHLLYSCRQFVGQFSDLLDNLLDSFWLLYNRFAVCCTTFDDLLDSFWHLSNSFCCLLDSFGLLYNNICCTSLFVDGFLLGGGQLFSAQ